MDFHTLTLWILSIVGLCSCQNELLDGPLNGAVGESVVFTLINPPSAPPTRITWTSPSSIEIVSTLGNTEIIHPDYTGRVSVNKTTASMELSSLTLSDTGEYTLEINSGGVVFRGTTSLTVFEKIPGVQITHSGADDTLIAGENSVNMTCNAQGSMITREWTKDGKPLLPRITLSPDNITVSISPVEREDHGEFTCQVSNPVTLPQTASKKLIVNYGPEKTKIKSEGAEVLGSQITLACSAESFPESIYTWTFNGIESTENGASYVIRDSGYEDSGNYTCSAFNNITKLIDTAFFELIIQEKTTALSTGAIVGIVIGVIIILAVVSGLTFYFVKKNGKMDGPKTHQARANNDSVELNYADISHFQRKNVQRNDQGNGGNGETLYSGVRLPSSQAGPNSGQGPTYADLNFPSNAAGMRAVRPKGQAPGPPMQVPDVTYAQVKK